MKISSARCCLFLAACCTATAAATLISRRLPVNERAAPAAVARDGFTMIIATHNRDELLPALLSHLTTSPPPSLRHILLVWQNVDRLLPAFLSAPILARDYPAIGISVRISKKNSMNERFRPILDWGEEIETDAVMIMDDDVVLRRAALEWGYQIFRAHNRIDDGGDAQKGGGIVGFSGRDFEKGKPTETYAWHYVLQPRETYSMVLSNAAWLRKSWLEMYWADSAEMEDMRLFVDDVFNCDDLLINFVVSNRTASSPMMLQPKIPLRTIPTRGLWNRVVEDQPVSMSTSAAVASPSSSISPALLARYKKMDHFEMRTECLSIYFNKFSQWAPAIDSNASASTGSSHYPLVHSSVSTSQDVEDRARHLGPYESWEEQVWTMYIPPDELEVTTEQDEGAEDGGIDAPVDDDVEDSAGLIKDEL